MLRLPDVDRVPLLQLLLRFGLILRLVELAQDIPGSYWGESEAGLVGDTLFARQDTPVHSILHESAHYICMTPERRAGLDRDAGGDEQEESAVCYLQILMADELARVGGTRLCADMDAWGYSFRLGSALRWFQEDAADARAWLIGHGLIDPVSRLTGQLRA